jgi:threonine synthase
MFTCPHTAVALAVLEKLVSRNIIKKTDRTVVVSTASGLKFSEFKVGYHERRLAGLSATQANPPVELPAEYGKVVDAIDQRVARAG